MTELMSATTLSKKLDIPESTIRWLKATGRLPYVKIGKLVRYDPAKIQRIIDRNSYTPTSL